MTTLPKEPYNKEHARELFDTSIGQAFDYLNSYFYKITNPVGVLYWNYSEQEFVYYKTEDVLKTFIPHASKQKTKIIEDENDKDVKKVEKIYVNLVKYWDDNTTLYTKTTDVSKPIFFTNRKTPHINMFLGLNKNTNKKLSEMDNSVQEGVKFIWKHVKEVLCNDDETSYKYVHNWICNAVCFKRNETALYFRSNQGTGKGSFTNFITKKVLSNKITHTTEDSNVLTKWNGVLEGKVMLVLEEMRSANKSEWALNSAALKTLITEPEITIKQKFIPEYNVKNHLNVIINTNKQAIKLEGADRRYFVADVSDKRIGDVSYFNQLHGYTSDSKVALGFYRYCHENIDETYNIRIIPITTNKFEGLAESLNSVLSCVKDKYLLQKKDLTCKFSEFYEVYKRYCETNKQSVHSKPRTSGILRESGIQTRIGHARTLLVDMKFKELEQLYEKKHWIHETDEFVHEEDPFDNEEKEVIEEEEDKKDIIKKQLEDKDLMIEDLKKQIEELKKQTNPETPEKKPVFQKSEKKLPKGTSSSAKDAINKIIHKKEEIKSIQPEDEYEEELKSHSITM